MRDEASRHTLLHEPFSAARANFFHAALEVPPLESARTLEPGSLYLRLRSTHARSNWEEGDGDSRFFEDDFDGTYHEFGTLSARWAPWERVELSARTTFAGWDEHHDRFELFNESGDPIVSDEYRKIQGYGATSRHVNLSTFGLGAKVQLFDELDAGFDFALAASVKIPFGRDRDLTHAGTTDVALAALATVPFEWGALHTQLGVTVPFGEQNLFVESEDVDLNPFAFAGVGITWRVTDTFALGLQVEANTSAFGDVDFLDGPAAGATVGARKLFGRWVVEAGAGVGFDWETTAEWSLFFGSGVLF